MYTEHFSRRRIERSSSGSIDCTAQAGVAYLMRRIVLCSSVSEGSYSVYSVDKWNDLHFHSISTVSIVLHYLSLYQLPNVAFGAYLGCVSTEKSKLFRSFAVSEMRYSFIKAQLYSP